MAFPRKYTPELDDIRLIIQLIRERETLYRGIKACSDEISAATKKRAELRRQARLLTCETIAEKFEINKDVVHCISKGISFKKEIQDIDPYFLKRND